MPTEIELSGDSTIVAAARQVSYTVAGEAVVLDLGAGVYYSLNPVAARVWELVQNPVTVDGINRMLLSEYDVDPETCGYDLLDLIRDLAARQLVTITS